MDLGVIVSRLVCNVLCSSSILVLNCKSMCILIFCCYLIESEPHLEEDEALAKALQESLNVESSPPPPPPRYDYGSPFPSLSYSFPYGYR